jgi:hypothetical protein
MGFQVSMAVKVRIVVSDTVQPENPLSVVTMYNITRQGVSLLLRQFSATIARRVLVFGIKDKEDSCK